MGFSLAAGFYLCSSSRLQAAPASPPRHITLTHSLDSGNTNTNTNTNENTNSQNPPTRLLLYTLGFSLDNVFWRNTIWSLENFHRWVTFDHSFISLTFIHFYPPLYKFIRLRLWIIFIHPIYFYPFSVKSANAKSVSQSRTSLLERLVTLKSVFSSTRWEARLAGSPKRDCSYQKYHTNRAYCR